MVSSATTTCASGLPLHYTDKALQAVVEGYVKELGPEVVVEIEGRKYLAQRHYIALHGLKAAEIESLVKRGVVRRVE